MKIFTMVNKTMVMERPGKEGASLEWMRYSQGLLICLKSQ
uniref:Uncharacterized protein n=1 Tax=Arundo donax TaxID=35708 RepID=A0A0A9BA95_ARUDO